SLRGTLSVVLMRPWIAKVGEHAVSHVFGHEPIVILNRLDDRLVIRGDNGPHVLRIETGRQRGRANKVAEHHCELSPFGGGLDSSGLTGAFAGNAGRLRRGARQGRDSGKEPAALPDGRNP